MTPRIPYIDAPELPLSFLARGPLTRVFDPAHPPSIKPFGTVVAIGVCVGYMLALRHAKQRGLDPTKMADFMLWALLGAFAGAHVLDAVFYHPAEVARSPLYLFAIWEGLSSYGGFIGAALGGFAWRAKTREPLMPGTVSDAWFAVRFPTDSGVVGRFDLGLYEMLLTLPLAVAFAILWQKRPERPPGFYLGLMCIAYAPVRFFLDFLRIGADEGGVNSDPRYGGLTPAQWACFGLLGLGVYFFAVFPRRPEAPSATPTEG